MLARLWVSPLGSLRQETRDLGQAPGAAARRARAQAQAGEAVSRGESRDRQAVRDREPNGAGRRVRGQPVDDLAGLQGGEEVRVTRCPCCRHLVHREDTDIVCLRCGWRRVGTVPVLVIAATADRSIWIDRRRRLSEADRRAIRAAAHETQAALARRYGVTQATISRILAR